MLLLANFADILPIAVATNDNKPPNVAQQQYSMIGSDDNDGAAAANNVVVVEAITLPAYAKQTQLYSALAAVAAPVTISIHRQESIDDVSAKPPTSDGRRQRRIFNIRGRGQHDSEQQLDHNDDVDAHHGSSTTSVAPNAIATPVFVLHSKVAAFKRRRKRRTLADGVVGGVVGGILLGPMGVGTAGVVLGALTAATAANVVGKHPRQKRLVRRLLREDAAAERS
jgi:hypothetical protein